MGCLGTQGPGGRRKTQNFVGLDSLPASRSWTCALRADTPRQIRHGLNAIKKIVQIRQAVASQLHRIGLEGKTIGWVFRSYKPKAITEWAEITIARMKRKLGFARTPAAFLMHHLKEASAGKLTPPDWWLSLKKEEFLKTAQRDRKSDLQRGERTSADEEREFREWLKADGQSVFAEAVQETVDELGKAADRRQIAELARLKAKHHFRRVKKSEAQSSQTT